MSEKPEVLQPRALRNFTIEEMAWKVVHDLVEDRKKWTSIRLPEDAETLGCIAAYKLGTGIVEAALSELSRKGFLPKE